MNGYRLSVWIGRDGIMSASCFSVSVVYPVADTARIVQHKKSHSRL